MLNDKKKTIIVTIIALCAIAIFITLGIIFFNFCNNNMLETMELYKNDNLEYKNSLCITLTFGILSIVMYSFASISFIGIIVLLIKRFFDTF